MATPAPCGCVKVGGGWNMSECTCPSLRALMGPSYKGLPGQKTLEESFTEAKGADPAPRGFPGTVGRETLPELLEELEISLGLKRPTEAEYLRRFCSIIWPEAGRTWAINARGDATEITQRVGRAPSGERSVAISSLRVEASEPAPLPRASEVEVAHVS